MGGTSSDAVRPIGFPQFSDSIATNSSARASIASAIFKRARWRSDGVESRQSVKALLAAFIALSTSALFEIGAVAKG